MQTENVVLIIGLISFAILIEIIRRVTNQNDKLSDELLIVKSKNNVLESSQRAMIKKEEYIPVTIGVDVENRVDGMEIGLADRTVKYNKRRAFEALISEVEKSGAIESFASERKPYSRFPERVHYKLLVMVKNK